MTEEQRVYLAVARAKVLAALMEVAEANASVLEGLTVHRLMDVHPESLAADLYRWSESVLGDPLEDLGEVADQMEARISEMTEAWEMVRHLALPHLPELFLSTEETG